MTQNSSDGGDGTANQETKKGSDAENRQPSPRITSPRFQLLNETPETSLQTGRLGLHDRLPWEKGQGKTFGDPHHPARALPDMVYTTFSGCACVETYR
ncbi:hypothetical protein SynBOUM118_00309 [Synechococcus sp. BOUM118]|nr:hypothetical protein SynBOUM118_00309 [Synechococcus sp. BOUM118]